MLELFIDEINSIINKGETLVSNTIDVMQLRKKALVQEKHFFVFDYSEDGTYTQPG